MTITRVPSCRVRGCPAPKNPEWHEPWCGHGLEGHHHHVPKRSQGGKRIVAFLCVNCHNEVDNGISLGNMVWEDKDGKKRYLLWNVAIGIGHPLIDRVIEAGKGEADGGGVSEAGEEDTQVYERQRATQMARPDGSKRHHRPDEDKRSGAAMPDVQTDANHGSGAGLEVGSAAATEDVAEGNGAQAGAKDGGLKGATFESSVLPVSTKASDDVAAASPASGEGKGEAKVPSGRQEPLGSAESHGLFEARSEGRAVAQPHPESSAAEGSTVNDSPKGTALHLGGISVSPLAAPLPFSKDVWCREGMQLVYWYIAVRDAGDEVRFKIGDWYNEGDRVLGEEAPGYLRGFEDVTVRQYSWVAGRVSPDTRVSTLAWTYHRAVAALEAPKQKEWLEKAQEENLSSKGLYRAIHGEKPKVKRWTAGDLRGWANQYGTPPQRRLLLAWIDWLEAK